MAGQKIKRLLDVSFVAAAVDLLRSDLPLTKNHREQIAEYFDQLLKGRRGHPKEPPGSLTDRKRELAEDCRSFEQTGMKRKEAIDLVLKLQSAQLAKSPGVMKVTHHDLEQELRRSRNNKA